MAANWVAVAGAALSAVSSLFGEKKSAEFNSALQYNYQSMLNQQNFEYNKKLINMQNAFNEAMMDKANAYNDLSWERSAEQANTAHQREVTDLRNAGLNPILSANGGASVVNPIQSAQASSGNSQLSSQAGMPDADFVGALSTANQMRNQNKQVENEIKNSRTTRDFTRAQQYKTYVDAQVNRSNSASNIARNEKEMEKMQAEIENSKRLTDAQVSNLTSQANLNNTNSARNLQEIKNLATENYNYGVDRYFQIGSLKFGYRDFPNQKKEYVPYNNGQSSKKSNSSYSVPATSSIMRSTTSGKRPSGYGFYGNPYW